MADNIISRKNRDIDITLHTATASATTLDMRDVAGAVVSFGTMLMAAWLTSRLRPQARTGEPMPCPMKCSGLSISRSSRPPLTALARLAW